MTTALITFCILLLVAYIFDLTASKTRIPSVILLLLLGWILQQTTKALWIIIPDFSFMLPILGTIGLILIVLDGSLELEYDRSKLNLIKKSFLGSLFNMLVSSFIISFIFYSLSNNSYSECLINAIPFAIISSAIAIPSVINFASKDKEYIVYDSSFSDIIGITLFTFIVVNDVYDVFAFTYFGIQIIAMVFISFVATIALSYLLSKIKHSIKFIPIILIIILIYSISEIYHLPALIFILLFGLFIGNSRKLIRYHKIHSLFNHTIIEKQLHKFKDLTSEATFLIRSLFFLALGFLTDTTDILNTQSLLLAFGIVVVIFALRAVQLKYTYHKILPLLFVAPRGLITILLFLSLDSNNRIPLVTSSLILQVVVITTLIMMIGLIFSNKNKEKDSKIYESDINYSELEMLSELDSKSEKTEKTYANR